MKGLPILHPHTSHTAPPPQVRQFREALDDCVKRDFASFVAGYLHLLRRRKWALQQSGVRGAEVCCPQTAFTGLGGRQHLPPPPGGVVERSLVALRVGVLFRSVIQLPLLFAPRPTGISSG